MCGIVGKLSLREPVTADLLNRMCAVIEHRGPDSRGTFLADGVGLGIQRLRILDLETGDQPIYNEDGSVVVVLNGEIYDYRERRVELERRGHRFATRTDTEVIVHLYEEYGDACVDHLRGMFAFALWDRRRKRLLIARDRIGKKPLFYAERDGRLWFASEPKAILQDPVIPRDVNFDAIDSFLHYQYVPSPQSAFAALRKLPPAHILTWEQGSLDVRRYWKLSYANKLSVTSEAELQEMIRAELLEATRLRLRSDVPLGAFLSGGVDSSAVVAAMSTQLGGAVKTFSIGFDVPEFDETRYAREVATLFETDHHEFRVAPDALSVLPRLIWHYGEPFADQSAIPSFHLAELTRQHVTVALNGDGGDENFAGYPRYVANTLADKLSWVPRPAAVLAARGFARLGPGPKPRSLRTRLGRLSRALSFTPADRYAMWIAYFDEDDRRQLYEPEFLASLEPRSAPSVIADAYEASDAEDPVERLLDVDVETYLPGCLLVKMDIATMAHSLEVRSPLLDHKFMEFAASVPAHTKLDGSTTKRVFKDALRPWLPDHILDRRKMGFGVPISEWFRGSLRDLPRDVLLDDRARQRGMLREDRVRALIDDHVAGTRDNGNKLWALLQLELWLQTYIDSPVAEPLVLTG